MPRRRDIEWRVEMEVREGVRAGRSGPDIFRQLEVLERNGEIKYVPSLRTIQSAMQRYAAPDPSGAWALSAENPDDIPLLLSVALAAVWDSDGQDRMTNKEAELSLRIRAAVPELGGSDVLDFARAYIRCESRRAVPDCIDLALVLQPWLSKVRAEKFYQAIGGDLTPFLIELLPHKALFAVAEIWHDKAEQEFAASRPRKARRRREGKKS